MDDVFFELEKSGKTDVDSLVQWMKDSNIIASGMESNVRQLFKDVVDQQHVQLAKFKDVLAKIAAEQSKTAEQLSKQLAKEGPKFINAAVAGLDKVYKDVLKSAGK